jgi:hypothetical protein
VVVALFDYREKVVVYMWIFGPILIGEEEMNSDNKCIRDYTEAVSRIFLARTSAEEVPTL